MAQLAKVTFTSAFIEVAVKLFEESFSLESGQVNQYSRISASCELNERYSVRDIRSWLADASACGLVTSSSCNVVY